MTDKEMEVWLVQWFNQNAAGSCRNKSYEHLRGAPASDISLVLMAFDLHKLSEDIVTAWCKDLEASKK